MIPEVPFKKHFVLGHTLHFANDTLGFVTRCTETNLPLAKAKIGFKNFVFLFEPESILHILQKNNKNYVKSFAYRGLKEFLGNGLLTSEGKTWLKNRRVLQPSFIQKEIVLLQKTVEFVVDGKIKEIEKNTPINLQNLFLDWTKDILLQSFFGLNETEIKELGNIHEHLWLLRTYANDRLKNPFMAPASWPTKQNKAFKNAITELEKIILKLFNLSRSKPEKGKLIQHILEQKEANQWNDQQIFDEIITLFLAGQETTTNALVFLVECLSNNPEYIVKASDIDNPLQWEHIINEVLRLYPPAWAVSREALDDDEILTHKISKGTTVFLSIYAVQRHLKYWDNPNEFKPERFLTDYSKQAFIPFGIGPRMCIGNHFSMLEMKIIIDKLFKTYHLENVSKEKFELITPMTLGPKHPILIQFTKKSHSN
jgi:cytochrome P450